MQLSEHFSLRELTMSAAAKRRGLDNTPNSEALANLKNLATFVLEPLRKLYGKPIIVTSGYRSQAVNKVVGGAVHSQHTQGKAADIKCQTDTREGNKELFDAIIKSGLPFDQVINEYNYDWVHVSYNPMYQRGQIMKCERKNGRAVYTDIGNTYMLDGRTAKSYLKK